MFYFKITLIVEYLMNSVGYSVDDLQSDDSNLKAFDQLHVMISRHRESLLKDF